MFYAILIDGHTGRRYSVDVVIEPHQLRLFTEEGRPFDDWPVKGLQFAEKVVRGHSVRLAHVDHGRTRLVIDNPAIVRELRGVGITLRVNRSAWGGLPRWAIANFFACYSSRRSSRSAWRAAPAVLPLVTRAVTLGSFGT